MNERVDRAMRQRLMTAYKLTEYAGLQEACWALADQGDSNARQVALGLQDDVDKAARDWAWVRSIHLGLHEKERVLEMVQDAREFLTVHVRELDEVLTEIQKQEDERGR